MMAHSISYALGDNLNRKETTRAEFQNLNFLILHPILNEFFFLQNDQLHGLFMEHKKNPILFRKGVLKGTRFRNIAF